MDKSSVVNTFTNYVDQLRTTECSQKEKIGCFQHIAECILSPAMLSNINYATHCSSATSVLLLFCEDLDSVVRMSAEENLNKIFRSLEKARVSRILMDLYGEIKRNGNQRSLRICLNLFSYYSPHIREKHVKWYALRMLPCMQSIASRKETQLCETLCEFVKSFGKYLQMGLTDSETCKLFEVFISYIGSECAVKRRCSSQNCISLIENSRNRKAMAKHALNKIIEILLSDHQLANTVLGVLGFLRTLLPIVIREDKSTATTNDWKQIVEIYDYCLHLLSTSNTSDHSIINASLEVINSILQSLDGTTTAAAMPATMTTSTKTLEQLLCNHQLQHNEYLKRRKSLKNQIFQLKNLEMTCNESSCVGSLGGAGNLTALESSPSRLAAAGEDNKLTADAMAPSYPVGIYSQTITKVETFVDPNATATAISTSPSPLPLTLLSPSRSSSPSSPSSTNKNIKITSELNKYKTSRKSTEESIKDAFKLGMQKNSPASAAGVEAIAVGCGASSVEEGQQVLQGGNEVKVASSRKIKNDIADEGDENDDDDDDDVDDAGKVNNRKNLEVRVKVTHAEDDSVSSYGKQKNIRNSPAAEGPGGGGGDCIVGNELQVKIHDADADDDDADDDDDDDGFTTLLEINEPNQTSAVEDAFEAVTATSRAGGSPQYLSTTSSVDVGNLIDALDAGSSGCLSDDKSQLLSDIDNESFNSIDFESEITIGGGGAFGSGADDGNGESRNTRNVEKDSDLGAAEAAEASGRGKSTDTTFSSFFNNLLSHSNAESVTKLFRSSVAVTSAAPPPAALSTTVKVASPVACTSSSATPTTTKSESTPLATKTKSCQDKSGQQPHIFDDGAAVADSLSLESINSHTSLEAAAASGGLAASDLRNEQDLEMAQHQYSNVSSDVSAAAAAAVVNDDTLSTSASVTASTAILLDNTSTTNTRNTECMNSDDDVDANQQAALSTSPANPFTPAHARKPVLLQLNIGSIYDQAIIYYTTRFIAARFLLTGRPGGIHSDLAVRVSIKNLSLSVVANCVRLMPQVLGLPLEISSTEMQRNHLGLEIPGEQEGARVANISCGSASSSASGSPSNQNSDSSSNFGRDFDHLDEGGDVVDFPKRPPKKQRRKCRQPILDANLLLCGEDQVLLDIKDDHFGESTTTYFLNQPLSRSADPVLLSQQVGRSNQATKIHSSAKVTAERLLSKSEIIESNRTVHATPSGSPRRQPTLHSKQISLQLGNGLTVGKSYATHKHMHPIGMESNLTRGQTCGEYVATASAALHANEVNRRKQILADVLLFYNHSDPILRGGVQIIIGNFVQSTLRLYHNRNELFMWPASNGGVMYDAGGANAAAVLEDADGQQRRLPLEINRLLAILIKGLEDDIHTVVIHALNAFHKIFPLVMAKYLTGPRAAAVDKTTTSQVSHHYQQHPLTADNAKTAANDVARSQERNSSSSSCLSKCPDNVDDDGNGDSDSDDGNFYKHPADDDELIDALLKSFEYKIDDNQNDDNENVDCDNNKCASMALGAIFISPKLLLNKLRLCYHNKYWLVQNKYAEVTSNLSYDAIREYYGADVASTYENIFLDELLQLVGDEDCRVREHTAECLSRFIIEISKNQPMQLEQQQRGGRLADEVPCSQIETYHTNFNLLWDFFDYSIFFEMSEPLRDLFRVNSSTAPPLESRELDPLLSMQRQCCFSSASSSSLSQTSNSEEQLLAKVLYRMTNKLMELDDKNLQFGIIHVLKVLLKHFNFVDYQDAWTEFNFTEICLNFAYYNYTTAVDIHCQNDLIDVTAKLLAGNILTTNVAAHSQFVDNLLVHTMKIINIYYHLFTNQKPLLFAKGQKSDLFTNAKELAIVHSVGYFGSDYVYIKLYHILSSANDSYKITINQESGSKLMSLLRTCINTLSLCLEMKTHSDAYNAIKLIEETIQYLTKLINYAPVECIGCLRQMLKYLFGRNYGNRYQDYYESFIFPYFKARGRRHHANDGSGGDERTKIKMTNVKEGRGCGAGELDGVERNAINAERGSRSTTSSAQTKDFVIFGELFVNGTSLPLWKSNEEHQCAKHIKLFEPLVIYCLTVFMKSNARVQAPVLELLSQLLDLNVTYSILDAKNVIFAEIMNNLELIETGIARNGSFIIPATVRFLVQLTHQCDRKLFTIPKMISIANNLLANNTIREYSISALKSLAYEIFLMSDVNHHPVVPGGVRRDFPSVRTSSYERIIHDHLTGVAGEGISDILNTSELETQKEVVLGMLEKFIDSVDCQKIFAILLLRDRSMNVVAAGKGYSASLEEQLRPLDVSSAAAAAAADALQEGAIYSIITRALCDGRITVNDYDDFFVLDALFKNSGKNVLSDSKEFSSMLSLFITKDVGSFSDLSYATIILENVILKTEEIYLVNHIKLYLKNSFDKECTITETPSTAAVASFQRTKKHPHMTANGRHTVAPSLAHSVCGPSTSSAAAAVAAASASSSSSSASSSTSSGTNTTATTGSSSSSKNEINYFAKVLCEKLDRCFASLTTMMTSPSLSPPTMGTAKSHSHRKYCGLVVRFVRALYGVSKKDALQSVFRMMLAESNFWDKYNLFGLSDELLQVEVLKLFSAMEQLDRTSMLHLIQADGVKWSVQRTLLRHICLKYTNAAAWNLQQVQQLFTRNLLNTLITENFAFVCDLCEVDEEFFSSFRSAVINNCEVLERTTIRVISRIILRLGSSTASSIDGTASSLQLLAKLFNSKGTNRALDNQIERTARRIIAAASHDNSRAILKSFMQMEGGTSSSKFETILFNNMELLYSDDKLRFEQKIIDEKWLFAQITGFSSNSDPEKLAQILLDINSENKLYNIFIAAGFDLVHVLKHSIDTSLKSMLSSFRNSCIQFNPHIHYMKMNPLGKVAVAVLMARIDAVVDYHHKGHRRAPPDALFLAAAVISLMENIKQIEEMALIYIESKFIDKFLREHLLRVDYIATLLNFIEVCCNLTKRLLSPTVGCGGTDAATGQHERLMVTKALDNNCNNNNNNTITSLDVYTYLKCIDAMLKQKFIWTELNQTEKCHTSADAGSSGMVASPGSSSPSSRDRCLIKILDVLFVAVTKSIRNTIFYKRNKMQLLQVVEKQEAAHRTTTPSSITRLGDNASIKISLDGSRLSHSADDDPDTMEGMANAAVGDAQSKNAKPSSDVTTATVTDKKCSLEQAAMLKYFPKAIFIAKLIETKIDIDSSSSSSSPSSSSSAYALSSMGYAITAGRASGVTRGGGCGAAPSRSSCDIAGSCEGNEIEGAQVPMKIFKSIGISILRTNQFYAYAVTPFEIVQQQNSTGVAGVVTAGIGAVGGRHHDTQIQNSNGKLPSIPVENLSDVDVLRKFVKRLSIFGFTTRQHFEEYFMTFLLLINKVYDENMVDQQEQFQIKSTCLEAILELLITFKTFPIVGNKLSHFHHTTRWGRINCDSISMKKLHKVQLIVSDSNIFYYPNLERNLSSSITRNTNCNCEDNVIGTKYFLPNQYDLNFIWQQMESYSQSISPSVGSADSEASSVPLALDGSNVAAEQAITGSQSAEDTSTRNFQYFTENSGIDFKSSSQLIFDVLMQIIECNHILVLPNLVKFCEICDSREQIKCIKDKALKLQEAIPLDDTISHQHIIYLLCKTQAMLIPSLGELQHLCALVTYYLKSSHAFIRNATLAGLLCLLECCSKTNTTIGKLSEELSMLRDLIVGYISRHGIVLESSIHCSDVHAKLVWTLNFSLIEWTSKFVPQCQLLANTIISASKLLKRTTNEDVYLCVLHGLERIIVINIATPEMRSKIEKLALELIKLENEKFSIPALMLLLSCMYMGSSKQLENTELSNGIVQDDPEIIAQQTDKVDILLHCIKSSTRSAAWTYGQVLCQIIRDLVPPNEILTKVIKEFLAINQPHCEVIAMIVYQVFRSAIDSSFLQMLQDWLICSLPTFLALPEQKGVWGLTIIFLSASINMHLIKLFPVVLSGGQFRKLGHQEIALFVTSAQDFHSKLSSADQKTRFRDAFKRFHQNEIFVKMLQSL